MTTKRYVTAPIAVLLIALLALVTFTASAVAPKKVLFIGNSYTYYNKMPMMVDSLARSIGENLQCTAITKGGQSLKGHLENPKLIDTLRQGGWDYVVIQEQSSAPAKTTREVIANVYTYARTLDSLAKAGSPDAKVIFYMTGATKTAQSAKPSAQTA